MLFCTQSHSQKNKFFNMIDPKEAETGFACTKCGKVNLYRGSLVRHDQSCFATQHPNPREPTQHPLPKPKAAQQKGLLARAQDALVATAGVKVDEAPNVFAPQLLRDLPAYFVAKNNLQLKLVK